MHTSKGTLPDARALLYHECIELLLLRWRQPRGEPDLLVRLGLSQFRSNDLLALLARLGFAAHEQAERHANAHGPADLSEKDVLDILADGFKPYDAKRHYEFAYMVLHAVTRGNGLLLQRGPKVYAFPHRTFQEFLAGYHLIDQHDYFLQCGERADQTHWREALLLMTAFQVAGPTPEKPLMLAEQLFQRGPLAQVLAGEMLAAVGHERARQYNPKLFDKDGLWPRARAALLQLATQGHAPEVPAPLRVRAGLALGTICYGSTAALTRPGTPRPPLPDPRLPLAVIGPQIAQHANWRAALDRYWCAIEPGAFWFGDDRSDKPLQQVRLDYAYKIARYPLTNAEFARFIAASGYDDEQWWTPEGWKYLQPGGYRFSGEPERLSKPRYFDHADYNNPAQPVVGVSWYEAAAYANWLTAQGHTQRWLPTSNGLWLPTALEYERSARHTDQRRYPWGDQEPEPEWANYDESGMSQPSPVGCFPRSTAICGATDLSGNVMEWLATLSGKEQTATPQKDFTPNEGVLLRDGAFRREREQLCCGSRFWLNPFFRYGSVGFRLVWSRARGV